MTTGVDQGLTEAEKVFKSVIWDPMVQLGETALEAAVPELDLPVIKQADEEAIHLATEWIFSKIILWVDIEYLHFKNAEVQAAWAKSSEALVIISQEQGTDSDAYKKALAQAASDFSQSVRFRGNN